MAHPVARLATDRRILALLQQCAVLATGFVSGIALAHDLGPVDRGHYSIIQTLYVLATPALSFGVPLKLMAPSATLPSRRVVCVHVGCAAVVGGVLTNSLAPPSVVPLIGLLVIGPVLVSWSETVMARGGFAGHLQYVRTADILMSSAAVVCLHVVGALTLMSVTMALYLPTILLRGGVILLATGRSRPSGPVTPNWPSLYRSALGKVWPRELLSVFAAYFDIILAALLLSPFELGIYAVASALGKLALAPFSALYGEVVRRATGGDPVALICRTLLPVPAGLVGIAAVLAVVLGKGAIELTFGSQYVAAAGVVPLLLIAFLFGGMASMFETIVLVAMPARVSAWARLAALVAGLATCGIAVAMPDIDRTAAVVAAVTAMNLTAVVLTLRVMSGGVAERAAVGRGREAP